MNQKESERLTKLETQFTNVRLEVGEVKSDIKKIMRNELPHLKQALLQFKLSFNKKIGELDKKVALLWLKVSIITTSAVVVLNYLVRRFLP